MKGPGSMLAVAMRSLVQTFICVVLVVMAAPAAEAVTIVDTKHNLSVTGPGQLKAQTETRVCVFCHTPHNANPSTPLWNREVGSQNYILYSSLSMSAVPVQPNGPSRLCLSCHDGTIALGSVLHPVTGIAMTGQIEAGSPSNVGGGFSLAGDHPFSFSYYDALGADPPIRPVPPADLVFYNNGVMECSTCHDPHRDGNLSPDKSGQLTGKFLAATNRFSELCLKCHDLPNWIGSAHQQSTALVDSNVFPVSPRQWPTWQTVAEWGCEICHATHSAQSPQQLLYYPTEAEVCSPCHGGSQPPGDPHAVSGALKGITAQSEKMSGHRMNAVYTARTKKFGSLPLRLAQGTAQDVTCADCHNPHAMAGKRGKAARKGKIAGKLKGVSGVDRNGSRVASAAYEYEVCFKCHADQEEQVPFIQRVVSVPNKRLQFDTMNPSFHPVIGRGRNPNVPSLPSEFEPELTVASTISCTDCHRDDAGGSGGPHGSSFSPILRERYETADHTRESFQSYALCYRCHSRASILSDESFQKKIIRNSLSGGGHSGHLAAGAPCSACHDAHGVNESGSWTGDHSSLMNFDLKIVRPKQGKNAPVFTKRGAFAGSCTLVCHGRVHTNESYP